MVGGKSPQQNQPARARDLHGHPQSQGRATIITGDQAKVCLNRVDQCQLDQRQQVLATHCFFATADAEYANTKVVKADERPKDEQKVQWGKDFQ